MLGPVLVVSLVSALGLSLSASEDKGLALVSEWSAAGDGNLSAEFLASAGSTASLATSAAVAGQGPSLAMVSAMRQLGRLTSKPTLSGADEAGIRLPDPHALPTRTDDVSFDILLDNQPSITPDAYPAGPAIPVAAPYYGPESHVDSGLGVDGGGGALYFPTEAEVDLIGGDYRRGQATNEIRAPGYPQNFSSTFPYEDPNPNFFARNEALFSPIDNTLRFLSPHEALVAGNSQTGNFSFGVDGRWPLFFSGFDPNRALVKAGPLYLDVLSAGAGVIYSDYRSATTAEPFPPGEEDGWIGYLELTLAAYLQISNNFYIAASATVFYLPGTNEFGVRVGTGLGGPSTLLFVNFEDDWGLWDVRGYNRFSAYLGFDLYGDAAEPAFDQAGRYSFGISDFDRRSSNYFDGDSISYSNLFGASASRPLGRDWRFYTSADRTDFWGTADFDDHSVRYHAGALVGYEGSYLPFSPYVSYDGYTDDDFDSLLHTAYVGGRGRITENLRIDGRGGYFWTTDREPEDESWLWSVGLTHDISESTVHSLRGGQDFFASQFTDEFVVSEYIRYDIQHQLSETLFLRGYLQGSEDEGLTDRSFTGHRELYGGELSVLPRGYTGIFVGAYTERRRQDPAGIVDERYLYYCSITRQITTRTSLKFRYQFEDVKRSFDEHMFRIGLTRYF